MKSLFKSDLRPFVGLDGTFLKGKAKGQLLVVVGQDSANHFYLLAWAIVDKETKLTSIFTYEEDFKDQIKNISQVDDDGKKVVEDLLKYPPNYWSRAFFDTVYKNQSVDNNLTESFNAWILQAGHKPISKMLEDIRIKVMNMVNEREAEVMIWGNEYNLKTMELYNQFMIIALKCHVNGNAYNGYEVTESSYRHIVNLRLKKCTCRSRDICGIPCPHAICALLHKKVDPLSQIHWKASHWMKEEWKADKEEENFT
ncbi:uncharacterized protein [Nicotiana sylvestris]|uniref:uncharacterized protein n=1 Tax=Nicotiana sylvestris TaxID=4096 RepID=UPI00388C4386